MPFLLKAVHLTNQANQVIAALVVSILYWTWIIKLTKTRLSHGFYLCLAYSQYSLIMMFPYSPDNYSFPEFHCKGISFL